MTNQKDKYKSNCHQNYYESNKQTNLLQNNESWWLVPTNKFLLFINSEIHDSLLQKISAYILLNFNETF